MFGALNRLISGLDADTSSAQSHSRDNAYGFQVLRNKNPDLPLEPWFDFIIGINGHLIDEADPNLFTTEVRNCAGSNVSLELWSAKGQRTHRAIVPISPSNPTLGVTLQLAPLSLTQNIWHVLSIPSPQSPAYLAGLLPHSDYILGTPSGTLRGETALGELVEDHLNRSLTLWVYNNEFDVVREVEIVPNRNWGGEGALGAVLGYGALHRLPLGLGEEVEGPGEVVFATKEDGHDAESSNPPIPPPEPHFLVPANIVSPPANAPKKTVSPGTRHGRKNRHAHAEAPSFDDYFKEGEQRSQKEDYIPSTNTGPVAPPPRAGGQVPPPPATTAVKETVEGPPDE
ncbi:golgi reassembly-stacking protein 2 [Arthroderma uncinatum]|uniref:golgi reassembly-stacking protein 2 n=1 Tax=Arthroderma uncinatum TaxID=74035 RepID=UPI00144ABFC6|nr:golgi reassembly-stacking protein 2 [Arthroderma uncinatum]KAF3480403.1 golgi reassembly-stacking protein 2 [Arthroderma uncinatum]